MRLLLAGHLRAVREGTETLLKKYSDPGAGTDLVAQTSALCQHTNHALEGLPPLTLLEPEQFHTMDSTNRRKPAEGAARAAPVGGERRRGAAKCVTPRRLRRT